MVIHINPNRINTPASGRPLVSRERPRDEKLKSTPKRVDENFIPEPESLASMIRSAIASLRQGVFWDRGTILNLVV
jgi:hypothetical protein